MEQRRVTSIYGSSPSSPLRVPRRRARPRRARLRASLSGRPISFAGGAVARATTREGAAHRGVEEPRHGPPPLVRASLQIEGAAACAMSHAQVPSVGTAPEGASPCLALEGREASPALRAARRRVLPRREPPPTSGAKATPTAAQLRVRAPRNGRASPRQDSLRVSLFTGLMSWTRTCYFVYTPFLVNLARLLKSRLADDDTEGKEE